MACVPGGGVRDVRFAQSSVSLSQLTSHQILSSGLGLAKICTLGSCEGEEFREVWCGGVWQDLTQREAVDPGEGAIAGAVCFFAYLYIRPLIRRGLGSASQYALALSPPLSAHACVPARVSAGRV